jgi:hypothetical protein
VPETSREERKRIVEARLVRVGGGPGIANARTLEQKKAGLRVIGVRLDGTIVREKRALRECWTADRPHSWRSQG